MIWVRCGGNAEHAMKAADNLLHAGGFGVIVLDLCHISERVARRIPLSYWYRFRLAIENTPSILLLVEREPLAKSCAALSLDMKCSKAVWTGAPGFRLLRGMEVEASRIKPVHVRQDGTLRPMGNRQQVYNIFQPAAGFNRL